MAIPKFLRGIADRYFAMLVSLYPPYLGAGIRVSSMSPDFRRFEVEMPLRFYNRNYVGTHFGGSLFAMCDPFFMFILMKNLGPDYIVWDKATTIRFRRPGRGTMRAVFELGEQELLAIRDAADTNAKFEPILTVLITDQRGETVAEVNKVLYVRRKHQGTGCQDEVPPL
ncbi:MAG: DUF4442 domain-containing protein [Bradymonadaceae bacterium]|nr:DUF4442 domain-containing protein [Lujinxingiaceae bacterium]